MQHDGSAVCNAAPYARAAHSTPFDCAWTKSFWRQPYIRISLTVYVYFAHYTANTAPCWHYPDNTYNIHSVVYRILYIGLPALRIHPVTLSEDEMALSVHPASISYLLEGRRGCASLEIIHFTSLTKSVRASRTAIVLTTVVYTKGKSATDLPSAPLAPAHCLPRRPPQTP